MNCEAGKQRNAVLRWKIMENGGDAEQRWAAVHRYSKRKYGEKAERSIENEGKVW